MLTVRTQPAEEERKKCVKHLKWCAAREGTSMSECLLPSNITVKSNIQYHFLSSSIIYRICTGLTWGLEPINTPVSHCLHLNNVSNTYFSHGVGCLSYIEQIKWFDFGWKHDYCINALFPQVLLFIRN